MENRMVSLVGLCLNSFVFNCIFKCEFLFLDICFWICCNLVLLMILKFGLFLLLNEDCIVKG